MLTPDNLETLSFQIDAAHRLLSDLSTAGDLTAAEYDAIVRGLHAAWAFHQEVIHLRTDLEIARRDLAAAQAEVLAERAARERAEAERAALKDRS